jgi:hypothetical protein
MIATNRDARINWGDAGRRHLSARRDDPAGGQPFHSIQEVHSAGSYRTRPSHTIPRTVTATCTVPGKRRQQYIDYQFRKAGFKKGMRRPVTNVANSDAKALATYLGKLGFDVDAERVKGWLVVLSVLVTEWCGGLSLAVGISLAEKGPSDQIEHQRGYSFQQDRHQGSARRSC